MKSALHTATALLLGAFAALVPCSSKENPPEAPTAVAGGAAPGSDPAPGFSGASAWLNSGPLGPGETRGRVVLVQFWTYTCVNWLRTLPYTRAWADKYEKDGLLVVGVHAPEFAFEQDPANVRRAAAELGVTYPVALDPGHRIWQAWNNQYWPAVYLVDAKGNIRYRHFGEGQYAQTERMLQQLLAEAGHSTAVGPLVTVQPRGVELAADHGSLRSAEDYVGLDQARHFASPGGGLMNARRTYAFPTKLPRNRWALSGDWTLSGEGAVLAREHGRAAYCFHARDLNLVMGPPGNGNPIRFRVLIDGQPPGASHGADVDTQGYGTATFQKMYQLVRQPAGVEDRRFEIEFLDPGVALFAFTFG